MKLAIIPYTLRILGYFFIKEPFFQLPRTYIIRRLSSSGRLFLANSLHLPKKVIHGNYPLDLSAVHVAFQTIGSDKHRLDITFSACLHHQFVQFSPHLGIVILGYGVLRLAEFHFAQIDDSVNSVNEHINLGAACASRGIRVPWIYFRLHACNAKCCTNFLLVYETDIFKGQSTPGIQLRRIQIILPECGITCRILSCKIQIEKAKWIGKPIIGIPFGLDEIVVWLPGRSFPKL